MRIRQRNTCVEQAGIFPTEPNRTEPNQTKEIIMPIHSDFTTRVQLPGALAAMKNDILAR
jgi:hypothetical protein